MEKSKEVRTYLLQYNYLGGNCYDNPKHPGRIMTHKRYILVDEEPALGKSINAHICLDIESPEKIEFDKEIKIINKPIATFGNEYFSKIRFDEFQKLFKQFGGTIEEKRFETLKQTTLF